MRVTTQSRGRTDLTIFATTLSAIVEEHLVAVAQAAATKVRSRAAQEAARTRESRAREARETPLTAARIELAHKGLARVMALGTSEAVKKIFDSLERLGHYSRNRFVLYQVTRPSGDAWEDPQYQGPGGSRDVVVTFEREHLVLSYGAGAIAQMTDVKLVYEGYNASVHTQIVSDLMNDIAGPYAANLSLARNRGQRVYEWEVEDVLFQFLVACAKKLQFERFLAHAAKVLERDIRDQPL